MAHLEGETRKLAALSLMKIGDRNSIDFLEATLVQKKEEGIIKALIFGNHFIIKAK